MNYSDNYLQQLAKENPIELIRILNDPETHYADLSFAAEFAGAIEGCEQVTFDALMKFLDHEIASVREGAIYGLCAKFRCETSQKPAQEKVKLECAIFNKFKDMIYNDKSVTIREIAKERLWDFIDDEMNGLGPLIRD